MKLTAKAIKATLLVDPLGLFAAKLPDGGPSRSTIEVTVGNRTITANLATKSVRKVIGALETGEHVVLLQGRLEGDHLSDAGISAQARGTKEAAPVTMAGGA